MRPSELRVDAIRLYPALNYICARENFYIRRRSPCALRAIHAGAVGRRRTFTESAHNGVRMSAVTVRSFELNGDCICFRANVSN